MSTRHDPEQYLHTARTTVREGLQLALKERAPEVESHVLLTKDLGCRMGCLEVFLLPPGEPCQHAFLLHSKLISRIFPTAEGLSRKLLVGMAMGVDPAAGHGRLDVKAKGAQWFHYTSMQAEFLQPAARSRIRSALQPSITIGEMQSALEVGHKAGLDEEEPLVARARDACLELCGVRDRLARARGARDAAAMHAGLREAERARLQDDEVDLTRAELGALCQEASNAVQRRDVVQLGQALEGWCLPEAAQLPRASEGSPDALRDLAEAARRLREWMQTCSCIHSAFEAVVASPPQERRARLEHLGRQLQAALAQGLRLPPTAEAAWRKVLREGMSALNASAMRGGSIVVARLQESTTRALTARLEEVLGRPLRLAALEKAADDADRLGVAAAAGPSVDDAGGLGHLVAEVQRHRAGLRALRARLEGALDALLGGAAPAGGPEPSASVLAAVVEEAGRYQAGAAGPLGFEDPSVAAGRDLLGARGLQVRRRSGHLLVRLGVGGAPPGDGASEAASAEVLTSQAGELDQRTTTDQGGWCFVPPGAEEFDVLLLGEPGLLKVTFDRASLHSWQERELEPDLSMLRVLRAGDPPLRYAVSLGGPTAAPEGWRSGAGVPLALIGKVALSAEDCRASQSSTALRRFQRAATGARVAAALSRGRRSNAEVGPPQDYTDDGGWCQLKDPSAGAVRLWPPLDGQQAYQPVDVVLASLPKEVELLPARSPSGAGTPSSIASASCGSLGATSTSTPAGLAFFGSSSTAGQPVQEDHTGQPIGLEGLVLLPGDSSSFAARLPQASQPQPRPAELAASSPRPLPEELTALPRPQPTELTPPAHSARAAAAETPELTASPRPAAAAAAEPPVEGSALMPQRQPAELAASPDAAFVTASTKPAEGSSPARQPQPSELPYPAFVTASARPAEVPVPSPQPQPAEVTASTSPRQAELTTSPRPSAAEAAEQGAPGQQRACSDGQQAGDPERHGDDGGGPGVVAGTGPRGAPAAPREAEPSADEPLPRHRGGPSGGGSAEGAPAAPQEAEPSAGEPLPRHRGGPSGDGSAEGAPAAPWTYAPVNEVPIALRETPEISGRATPHELMPGARFLVAEEVRGAEGVLFLRVADGKGWLFDRKPGVGIMCKRARWLADANP